MMQATLQATPDIASYNRGRIEWHVLFYNLGMVRYSDVDPASHADSVPTQPEIVAPSM